MWGKSFHKLCGFQGIHTNVMWDRRRGKKTPWECRLWGGVTQKGGRQGVGAECPRKTRDNNPTQVTATVRHYHPFAWPEIPVMHVHAQRYAHKWTIRGMLTATAPYAPSVLRGNLRNGTVRNFRYLKQSFTFLLVKEFKPLLFRESTEHLRLIHQPALLVCYPESMLRLK